MWVPYPILEVQAVQEQGMCASSITSFMFDFMTVWTVACKAPLSMEFSKREYWSGLLCPPPGDLPDPGIEPMSLTSPALADQVLFH